MTNGGGVTDAKRRVLLSKDMGLEVGPALRRSLAVADHTSALPKPARTEPHAARARHGGIRRHARPSGRREGVRGARRRGEVRPAAWFGAS